MSKHCPICDQDLDLSAFVTYPRDIFGIMPVCIICQSKLRIEARKTAKSRLATRPPHSENAAKKKCPYCKKYVYVEPKTIVDICYACGQEYKVTITLGEGTQPDNAHGIRLKRNDNIKRTRTLVRFHR